MPGQANDPIDDLAACLGKDLVAFINQPNPWGRCYAYPQYALASTGAEHIDATKVFPDKDYLPVTLVGHETAEYARDELGDIAILRLNAAPQEQAERYYKKDHSTNGSLARIFSTRPATSEVDQALRLCGLQRCSARSIVKLVPRPRVKSAMRCPSSSLSTGSARARRMPTCRPS